MLPQHGFAGGVGGKRLNRLKLHLSLPGVSAVYPPPVTEGLCCSPLLPFSTFAGWLDSFSSCLRWLRALWGRKHFLMCPAKCTNFSPLGSWLHCNRDHDIHNTTFVSYGQGSPGRRGPQGEQGEPGPKVSPDTQHCLWLCLLQAVSEERFWSAESSLSATGSIHSWSELGSLGWGLSHCTKQSPNRPLRTDALRGMGSLIIN